MPRARKHLICVDDTPYYHVTSRCVRRAFLCGTDKLTGKSYEHRRDWLEKRIRLLCSLFSVHLCAYAVMSNHYHLVVKLCPDESDSWSDDQVLARWTALFKGPLLVQRYGRGEPLLEVELETVRSMAAVYRTRLGSLSWFMKCLNEPIARRANAEDQCTGHFWEARFHSQPLLSEAALLAAMAYVDLNPIRAGLADSLPGSDYTSIQARLRAKASQPPRVKALAKRIGRGTANPLAITVRPLMPFSGNARAETLPIAENDYVKLLQNTGYLALPGNRGSLNQEQAQLLGRLGLSIDQWRKASTAFKQHYRRGDLRFKRSA